MTAPCLMLCLDVVANPLPAAKTIHLQKGYAEEALRDSLSDETLRGCFLFANSAQPLPISHATRVTEWLADKNRLAVGLAGCIYPELFDGRARSVWRPAAANVPSDGLRVNELALHGMAIPGNSIDLVCHIAKLYDIIEPAAQAHLSSLVALELHRRGWHSLLLPGEYSSTQTMSDYPPHIIRAVLEFGGLRRLASEPVAQS